MIAILFLAAASGTACDREHVQSVSLKTGAAAPSEWRVAPPHRPTTYLVWLVRTADCLSCHDVDFAFRRVQARWGDEVPLLVVHVGSERSESVPRAYLGNRRVRASVQTLSPRTFERRFGDAVIPAIYLVHAGMIAWTSSDLREPGANRLPLDSLVSMHRAYARPASRAAAPL